MATVQQARYPRWKAWLDTHCAMPLMALFTPSNAPALRTQFWNVRTLTPRERDGLDTRLCVECRDERNYRGWMGRVRIWPLYKMPRLGGWTTVAIIKAVRVGADAEQPWHIGWRIRDKQWAQVSLVPIRDNKVQCMLGPGHVEFFAVNEAGEQLACKEERRVMNVVTPPHAIPHTAVFSSIYPRHRLGDGKTGHIQLF